MKPEINVKLSLKKCWEMVNRIQLAKSPKEIRERCCIAEKWLIANEVYPDDERYGRSDLEFLADEVSYYYSLFEEDGHDWKDDYENAKRILRETQNGKVIPADLMTLNPREGYRPMDIENYKSLVNEVARVKRLGKKLQGMGYYGSWYTF